MKRIYNLISIVVPMYNEEEMIDTFFEELFQVMDALNESYEVICVNDGSQDKTLEYLCSWQTRQSEIVIVDFHKNFGKEEALTAGLEYTTGDIIIPIDADLQDPPSLIPELIDKWQDGYDEVLAIRADRSSDGWLKKFTASMFYKLFNKASALKIEYNAGDFRLLDRSIVDVVLKLPEKNRFMKGIFSWASNGNTAKVEYIRQSRLEGKTKWNYWKLFNFAIDGITAFSSFPLRVWSYIGMTVSLFAIIYLIYIFTEAIFFGNGVAGYASLMCAVLLLGGVQLISLGIIGEYIARIYNESKNRPLYLVRKCYHNVDGKVSYKSEFKNMSS